MVAVAVLLAVKQKRDRKRGLIALINCIVEGNQLEFNNELINRKLINQELINQE